MTGPIIPAEPAVSDHVVFSPELGWTTDRHRSPISHDAKLRSGSSEDLFPVQPRNRTGDRTFICRSPVCGAYDAAGAYRALLLNTRARSGS